METTLRLADAADAGQIQAIYAPIVSGTAISFELEPPAVEQICQRIEDTLAYFPWLVCERAGGVLGYAYAGRHRARAAYQWSVDVSVYVRADLRRSGVGRALYTSLFEILVLQGYFNAYAGIALPNPASVGLHEAMGFKPVGVYREVGFKLGAWHDVGWWHFRLQAKPTPPMAPLDLEAVRRSPSWRDALKAGSKYLSG